MNITSEQFQNPIERLRKLIERIEAQAPEPANPPKAIDEERRKWALDKVQGFDWGFVTRDGDDTKEMLRTAKRFCGDFLRDYQAHSLAFLGANGVGKSHLAERIRELWRQHKRFKNRWATSCTIRWVDFLELVRIDRAAKAEKAKAADFVWIDDAFAEHDSEAQKRFAAAKLYEILEARQRPGKWTVLTSNKLCGIKNPEINEIKEIDERISDRLHRRGGVILEIVKTQSFSVKSEL